MCERQRAPFRRTIAGDAPDDSDADGHLAWAEKYDRQLHDVFAVQEDIARSVAQALRITLSPHEEEKIALKPTTSLHAYDYFLRGRDHTRRHNRALALEMFDRALQLDPTFALAHAGAANICAMQYYQQDHDPRWIERAKAAGDRAFELAPELPGGLRGAGTDPLCAESIRRVRHRGSYGDCREAGLRKLVGHSRSGAVRLESDRGSRRAHRSGDCRQR
jgi:tetratricopeptide (TPR) repeat protein